MYGLYTLLYVTTAQTTKNSHIVLNYHAVLILVSLVLYWRYTRLCMKYGNQFAWFKKLAYKWFICYACFQHEVYASVAIDCSAKNRWRSFC